MRQKVKALFIRYRTLVLYTLIGSSGVLIDLLVFALLFNLVGVHESIATFISTTLGISNNFYWNTTRNFKVRDNLLNRYLQFYAVGLSGIMLTIAIFFVFSTIMGYDPNWVKVGSLFPVLLLQYTINKHWTFGIRKEQI